MALETASFIHQLVPANPSGADRIHQGDDHIRLLKAVLKSTFPNITGPVSLTQDQLNDPFVMPVGIITAWYGDALSVPAGWALCNGVAVQRSDDSGEITPPDLRNRALVGAGAQYNPGQTFGAASAQVNTSAAGKHTHTISGGAHTHDVQIGATTSSQSLSTTTRRVENEQSQETVITSASLSAATAHSHTGSAQSATHSHGVSEEGEHQHTVTVSTIPPSYGIHFIMKV